MIRGTEDQPTGGAPGAEREDQHGMILGPKVER